MPGGLSFYRIAPNFCPNLKALSLRTSYSINDYELRELAEKLDKLEQLTFGGCPELTEDGWIKAAPFLKQLRYLRMDECFNFRDQAVCAIVDSCLFMERMELEYVDLTCDGVSYIMLHASELVELWVVDNPRIDAQDMANILWQRPPRLQLNVNFEDESPMIRIKATKTPDHNSKIKC